VDKRQSSLPCTNRWNERRAQGFVLSGAISNGDHERTETGNPVAARLGNRRFAGRRRYQAKSFALAGFNGLNFADGWPADACGTRNQRIDVLDIECQMDRSGAVAGVVGIEGGVVSEVIKPRIIRR
jgi:hypothetical protein